MRLGLGLAGLILAGASAPALAGGLSPGDSYTYEIVRGGGERLRPVVYFNSPWQQRDGAGRLVVRNPEGNRVIDKGWTFEPHNGEFPDDGVLSEGREWSTDMVATFEGAAPVRQTRRCEVSLTGDIEAAGFLFRGAVRVDCAWSLPGAGIPFRNDITWYWREAGGYQLILIALQEGDGIGTWDIRLAAIESESFDTGGR